MSTSSLGLFAAPVLALASVGCNTGTVVDPGDAAVDGNKKLVDLTDDEAKAYCDAYAKLVGGYGKTWTCRLDGRDVEVTTVKDQAECIAGFKDIPKTCPTTRSEGEGCNKAFAADPCAYVKTTPPECSRAECRKTTTPDAGSGG